MVTGNQRGRTMKYLHLMHNDRFIQPYIDFVNKCFDQSEHTFLIIGGVNEDKIKNVKKKMCIKYLKASKTTFS